MASVSQLQVPQEPFLLELFRHWQQSPEATLIRDHSAEKKESSVAEFLHDVLNLRRKIFDSFDEHARAQLTSPDTDVFVAILAAPGYGFATLFFAIYSLGAVAVPLSPVVLLEEAKYLLELCGCALLATVPSEQQHAKTIADSFGFSLLSYDPTEYCAPSTVTFVLDSETPPIHPEKGFVLLYTSGTTGPPKGVLHSRSSGHTGLKSQVESFGLSGADTWLHHSPVHWGAGFTLMVVSLIAGTCVEFCSVQFNTDWLLERLSAADATCLYLPPSSLDALANKIDAIQSTWSRSRYEAALNGIRKLHILCSGAVRISPSSQAIWRDLRNGKTLVVVYAMTEFLSLVAVTDWRASKILPPGCCGTLTPNLQMKTNNAGEIFIRGPAMFKRYLSANPTVMKDVLDSEGYLRTGDVGGLEGDFVLVLGRADNDVMRVFGLKTYAPELEDELLHHPLISRAIALGVPHRRTGQQIAILLRIDDDVLRAQVTTTKLSLLELRRWLAVDRGWAMSKMPTMLRVVETDETLPTTASNKVIKSKVRDLLFNQAEVDSGKVEVCALFDKVPGRDQKPFDWAALQPKAGFGAEYR